MTLMNLPKRTQIARVVVHLIVATAIHASSVQAQVPLQPRPLNPPAPLGSPRAQERQFVPAAAATPPGAPATQQRPTCEQLRRKAKYNIYFDKVELEKLVQTVSDATCKTFILPENIRGKISVIGPENGKVEVDADQFYAAFLAALDSNSLTVYQHGRFLKIVDKQRAGEDQLQSKD